MHFARSSPPIHFTNLHPTPPPARNNKFPPVTPSIRSIKKPPQLFSGFFEVLCFSLASRCPLEALDSFVEGRSEHGLSIEQPLSLQQEIANNHHQYTLHFPIAASSDCLHNLDPSSSRPSYRTHCLIVLFR